MNSFSADEFFRRHGNRIPLQTEKAIRGLMMPFESLFPDSCVPHDVEASLPFLSKPARHSPKQPGDSFKKEWIEWILWEVRLRLELAVRFLELESVVSRSSKPPPIILFLREFRGVSHIADGDISVMAGGAESDIQLRERIEGMFPESLVFWIASPKDAITYCFTKKVNRNSYPYFARQDWLKCVEVLAKSANLIVVANTNTAKFFEWEELDTSLSHALNLSGSQGGVAQEIDLLRECGLIDRTLFCDAEKLASQLGPVRSVANLMPELVSSEVCGSYDNILDLAPMEHWINLESINYAGEFMRAIDNAWGYAHDVGQRRMTGDVIAALFMALATLAVVRGDLTAAAELHLDLANMIQRRPNEFLAIDAMSEGALRESAQWYQDNAELFSAVYRIRFSPIC